MSPKSSSLDSQRADWQESARARVRALLVKKQQRLVELDQQLLARTQDVALQLQQQIVEELELQTHRETVARQETLLEQLLEQVQNLHGDRQQQQQADPALAATSAAQAEHARELEALQRELDARGAELLRLEDALDHRERETELQRKNISKQLWARKAELLTEVERQRADVLVKHSGLEAQSQVRLAEELARTERLQGEIRRVEQQCDDARKLITDLRSDLDRERTIAREQEGHRRSVEEDRMALTAEVERLRAQCETAIRDKAQLEAELERSRAATERQVNELRTDQSRAFDERFHQLFAQIDSLTAERKQLQTERSGLQDVIKRLEETTERLGQEHGRLEDKILGLHEERDRERHQFDLSQAKWKEEIQALLDAPGAAETVAHSQLAEVQDQLALLQLDYEQLQQRYSDAEYSHQHSSVDGAGGDADLREQLELAEEEIRGLKAQLQMLSHQNLAGGNVARQPSISSNGSYDWEEQKRRLLEQLESDFDDDNPKERADKLTVAGAIRITDQVVANKDREIEELQSLLENQSENIGNVAVGAAAFASILDQDELIVQERENLRLLKEELQQKLRTTEVELSVERAKLGRERAEMEEQMRAFDSQRIKAGIVETHNGDGGRKTNRGAWLTRLGLKDQDK